MSPQLAGELIVNNTRQTAEECCRLACMECARLVPCFRRGVVFVEHQRGSYTSECAAAKIRYCFSLAPFETEKTMGQNNDGQLILLTCAICDAEPGSQAERDACAALRDYHAEQRAAIVVRDEFVRPEAK